MILSYMRRLLSSTSGRCVCCADVTSHRLFPKAHSFLCTACIQEFTYTPHIVEGKQTPYHSIFVYATYEGILQDIIPAYKYNAKLYYAPLLADMLLFTIHSLITQQYDYCIAIPQHIEKTRKRGLYHLGILTALLRKYTAIPISKAYLHVAHNYPSQQQLSAEERLYNVRDVFTVTQPMDNLRILLLDDVITTGATLYASAQALHNAGARHIDCIALAINKRGLSPNILA